ncbi:MAG: hypothetical protein QXK48_00650 [Candidatus Aenigmatarchaeota archaeon]
MRSLKSLLQQAKHFLSLIGEELKNPLGEISLYCEVCGSLYQISKEERKRLNIKTVMPPSYALKNCWCPKCGTVFGEGLYLYKA